MHILCERPELAEVSTHTHTHSYFRQRLGQNLTVSLAALLSVGLAAALVFTSTDIFVALPSGRAVALPWNGLSTKLELDIYGSAIKSYEYYCSQHGES
jgi:hypothetical protein